MLMSIQVAAFLGSPRKGGNSEHLIEAALEGAREAGAETRLFRLDGLSIRPCRGCGACGKTGRCVVEDDMVPIYEAIRASDRFILASPIHFFALSAQAKIMIDRCQAFWSEKYLLKKPVPPGPLGRKGLLLVVGAYPKGDDAVRCSETCARAFYHSINVKEFRTLSYLGQEGPGVIRKHPSAMAEAAEAGRWLADLGAVGS